jgi:hypothetical protein
MSASTRRRVSSVAWAAAAALGGWALVTPAGAQPLLEGFLCCNMRSDGKWISDINYEESGKTIIPVGTPVRVTGYGRQRVHIEVEGSRQAIGNDYSRTVRLEDFARRYVVAEDPRPKIAGLPPKIRDAILSARVTPGMTREQVVMAVGYPVTSENPHLDAPVWRMWLWTFSEFQLHFDGDRLREVKTDPDTRTRVVMP